MLPPKLYSRSFKAHREVQQVRIPDESKPMLFSGLPKTLSKCEQWKEAPQGAAHNKGMLISTY
jgi:hypothetical protein